MKLNSLEAIFRALQEAEARYLVVGGLAVIAHGYVRLTHDLDLVLDLSPGVLPRALKAFERLGYHPLVPVKLFDFADPVLRQDWIENRHMKVFNLVSDNFPDVVIDIFPSEPFVFEFEFAASIRKEIAPQIEACVISIPALIRLKLEAGRDRDRIDIEELRKLYPEL